jgi:hypothetical protein
MVFSYPLEEIQRYSVQTIKIKINTPLTPLPAILYKRYGFPSAILHDALT